MTRLILLVSLLAGCAEAPPPPAAAATANARGPAAHLFVQVTGFAANEGKVRRCADEVAMAGYAQDPSAPVRAVLILEGGSNRLQIVSAARGIVRNENLPGWDMGRLCRTAIDGILPVLAQEPPPGYSVAAPPQQYRPTPSVQLAPAPSPYAPGPYAPPPARRPVVVAPPPAPPTLLPPPADAPKGVADLARRGEQSFAKGDFGNALVAYAEANRLASSAPILFDTALCYRMLNRPQEALQYVQLYLDRAPQAPNRPTAERLAIELRHQLGDEE